MTTSAFRERVTSTGTVAVLLAAATGGAAVAVSSGAADPANPGLVSEDRGGLPAGGSVTSAVSNDGRFVAFVSTAPDLTAGDTNAAADVFLRDRTAGTTRLVSVDHTGGPANASSGGFSLAISADGRFVAFDSGASDLVPGDTNRRWDVFVWDRRSGRSELISAGRTGAPAQGGEDDVVHSPSISADGRYIAFSSSASNLVAGDDNAASDVFVRDRVADRTRLVSVSRLGGPADRPSFEPDLSDDGSHVSFTSVATDLVAARVGGLPLTYVRDLGAGTTRLVSVRASGAPSAGGDYASAISATGRYVAFGSYAADLPAASGVGDVFVWDGDLGRVRRVSTTSDGAPPTGYSFGPMVSAEGRYVAFSSTADNVAPGDANGANDVLVWDRRTGGSSLGSLTPAGAQPEGASSAADLSADGRHLAFLSAGADLAPGDDCCSDDVFVRDLRSPLSP